MRRVTTNHCPNHAWSRLNPHAALKEDAAYEYPAFPMYEASRATGVSGVGGSVGTLFNGAALYSAYAGPAAGPAVDYATSAPFLEGDTFDECGSVWKTTTGLGRPEQP